MHSDWKQRSKTVTTTDSVPAGWDAFVRKHPFGHHEQCSEWGRFKSLQGWRPIHQVILLDGKIIAGTLLLVRTIKRFITIGYVSRGPQYLTDFEGLAEFALKELHDLARKLSLTYLVIVPHYGAAEIPVLCQKMGYFPKPDPLPPSQVVTATLLVDLSKSLDQLFSEVNATTRNYVRRGMKAGMEFAQGGLDDVETFRKLMWQLCERRGTAPTPPQKDYFSKLWDRMGASGYVRVFICRLNGVPICGAFAFAFGNTLRVWKVGWTGDHETARPNHFLWWSLIQWAKEAGFELFDFVQIVPEHAHAILRGERPQGEYSGVTEFKMSFGGTLKILPEPAYRSFNPLLQIFLKCGGNKFLAHPQFMSWLQRRTGSSQA